MKSLSLSAIRFYQRHWSKKTGKCRFYPTCSNYAIQAIEKHGFLIGWGKTICRIFRCNPWNHGSCIDLP